MSGILGQSVWGKDGRAGGPRVSPSLTSAGVPFNPYTSRMRDPNVQAASGEAEPQLSRQAGLGDGGCFLRSSAPHDLPSAAGHRVQDMGVPSAARGLTVTPRATLSHSQISAASPTSCPLPDNHLFNKTAENAVSETREFYDVLKLCLIG